MITHRVTISLKEIKEECTGDEIDSLCTWLIASDIGAIVQAQLEKHAPELSKKFRLAEI